MGAPDRDIAVEGGDRADRATGRAPGRIAHHARRIVLDQPETLGDGDCEAVRPGRLGQPVNTATSLAYVAAGGWLLRRVPALPAEARAGAIAYATLAALNGAGSVAYHGPQFPGAQFLHDAPVAGLVAVGAAVPLWRAVRHRQALPGWSGRRGAALAATVALAGASYAAGRTTSPLCRPRSLWQFHGLWHVATAGVVALHGAAVWAPAPAGTPDPTARSHGGTAGGAPRGEG